MSEDTDRITRFLAETAPFSQLAADRRAVLAGEFQVVRFRLGEAIVTRQAIPVTFYLIVDGKVRLLAAPEGLRNPVHVGLLARGEAFGWEGIMGRTAHETAIASTDVVCLAIPAATFGRLVADEPAIREAYRNRPGPVEVVDVLSAEFRRQARNPADIKALAQKVMPETVVRHLPEDRAAMEGGQNAHVWFVSGGGRGVVGERWVPGSGGNAVIGSDQAREWTRLLGIPNHLLAFGEPLPGVESAAEQLKTQAAQAAETPQFGGYPDARGKGAQDGVLACFEMVAGHLQLPFRREAIRRVLGNMVRQNEDVSLQQCGPVAETAGLTTQFVRIPLDAFPRIEPPAMVKWKGHLVVVYEAGLQDCVVGSPEVGTQRVPLAELAPGKEAPIDVLLLQRAHIREEEKFSLRWFIPAIRRHRRVLFEVLVASFFVQLFTLGNPLITQVIIDKVLVQNSPDTLHVLGIVLVIIAIFGAVLTSLRTYLFADTTNRIDLTLGARIIDHLYRLSLTYFNRRPVGEISARLNELEKIRQFLTGTALTLVLDAVFSVVYIAVMMAYSVVLTGVSLAAVPLLGAAAILFSPVLRRQLRVKAVHYSATQSYLVETLSGVQTVKAQHLEMRSRWEWQDRYARYVTAGFRNVLTSTAVQSIATFLNRLSELGVLWVGAYMVLDHKLTLGQLIAFRIIASYVTNPLLRLVQSWQNFQEVGLSIERLADILDSPQEQSEVEAGNIPMVPIEGKVAFQGVTFSYGPGPAQLRNVNLDVAAGAFVGVVGQSGSGKSTLVKLLARLHPPNEGRILVDDYDIGKVELYSLRRQIGMVLQDSLLFEGTVQANIELALPDATPEQIIAAAKIAGAHDFIMSLPAGYNTRVGEQGRALSGGQRQRVAIARAVLQNPAMLILDEATSALDYQTERAVCTNLAAAFKKRTVFFVTHRLQSLRHADVILVMDEGRIVESGTHETLVALKGRYSSLLHQQAAQT